MTFDVNVPGINSTEKEFTENGFLQIKNMGINVVEAEQIKVVKNSEIFNAEYENKIFTSTPLYKYLNF